MSYSTLQTLLNRTDVAALLDVAKLTEKAAAGEGKTRNEVIDQIRSVIYCDSGKLCLPSLAHHELECLCEYACRQEVLNFCQLDKVTPKPVEWLWSGRIPIGKLTCLDGDPDLGKSTLLLDLAARVTQGWPMPDGSAGIKSDVIVLSSEDAADDTIVPRLMAAHADLEHVATMRDVADQRGRRPVAIPIDLVMIEELVTGRNAKLLILDPLVAFLTKVDTNNDQSIRRCLYQLALLAEQAHCAIVFLRHLNKGGSEKAMYRGGGSIGITGACRSVLLAAKDPEESEHHRILAVTKHNLAKKAPSLRYTFEWREEFQACQIGWCGESPFSADDLVKPVETDEQKESKQEEKSQIELAKEVLAYVLQNGPRAVKSCKAQLAQAGIRNEKTVRRAANELKLQRLYPDNNPTQDPLWQLPNDSGVQEPCPVVQPPITP